MRALSEEKRKQLLLGDRSAVAIDFDDIFSCVGSRCPHHANEDLIDKFSGIRVMDHAIRKTVRRGMGEGFATGLAEQVVAYVDRPGSGHADDTDRPSSQRCRDCSYCRDLMHGRYYISVKVATGEGLGTD